MVCVRGVCVCECVCVCLIVTIVCAGEKGRCRFVCTVCSNGVWLDCASAVTSDCDLCCHLQFGLLAVVWAMQPCNGNKCRLGLI